jgi:hypothetical protein
VTDPDQKVLADGAVAMLAAQADIPPAIIHTLRVLLNPSGYPPDHVKWVESGIRATLKHWEYTEDIEQLKVDLGLNLPKKRRKELTMKRETTIVAAIVNAALAGDHKPKRTAADKLQADDREVQRAWRAWKPVYLARLHMAASQAPRTESQRILAALGRLQSLK